MLRVFLLVLPGVALLAYLVVGIPRLSSSSPQPRFELSSLGDAFSGNVALPKAKIQAAFQEGSTLLAKHVQEAREARHLADIFEWVAFVLAGVVTLLAGALGIVGDRAAENALAMLQQQTADGSARAKEVDLINMITSEEKLQGRACNSGAAAACCGGFLEP